MVRAAAFLRDVPLQTYVEDVVRRVVPADLLASRAAAEHLAGLASSACPSSTSLSV